MDQGEPEPKRVEEDRRPAAEMRQGNRDAQRAEFLPASRIEYLDPVRDKVDAHRTLAKMWLAYRLCRAVGAELLCWLRPVELDRRDGVRAGLSTAGTRGCVFGSAEVLDPGGQS